ncbi:PmoA family protein [Chloroflexi bacterium TSY]|nr:PmoA family protein [Chloroflexi bacterium TSY]
MSYLAKQHLNHGQFGCLVINEETGHCLGGFGANYYRPWVFPLYTPNGLTVLQEFPYDHPFHNGFWVAQGPIMCTDSQGNRRETNLWPSPPMRIANEPIFENMGRMEVSEPQIDQLESGVRFKLSVPWRDQNEVPILDEVRTVDLYSVSDATICDMTSEKIANYGSLDYLQSKFGSIGIRVEPRLLPDFGGEIIADGGRRGTADVAIDQECDYVAYENSLPSGARFGVLMTSLDEPRIQRGPWFVRDYGMAMYNVNRNQPLHTPEGESWSVALRVVAYDEVLTEERGQRWIKLP